LVFEEIMVEENRALFESMVVSWWYASEDCTDKARFGYGISVCTNLVTSNVVSVFNILVVFDILGIQVFIVGGICL